MCILDICISSLLQCLFNILFPVGAIPGRIVFFFKLFIYLFTFDCAGSSLLQTFF